MKKNNPFLLIIVISFFSTGSFAQDEPVRFINGNFITGDNINKQTFRKQDISTAVFQDRFFVLVQFTTLPSVTLQQALKKAGVHLETYIPGKAYLATIKKDFDFTRASSFKLSSINIIPPFYKIDSELSSTTSGGKQDIKYLAISFYSGIDKTTVQQELSKAGAVIVSTKYTAANIIFIQVDKTIVNAIAAMPFVSNIILQSIEDKPLNYNSIAAHGVSGLNAVNGKNLNGRGVTIGIGDNADISTHIDFVDRLINRTPWKVNTHGTHVAGTVGGAGIIDVKKRGFAPGAVLVNQFFSNIITSAPVYVTDNHMVVTNNSYYSGDNGCPGNGEYDVLSNFVDNQAGTHQKLLHVVASGNDGGFSCTPFPFSYGTVKSGWQCAKNVLTVGAMNTGNYNIAGFSSRGPLKDGRIKPEIVAGGVDVFSTGINNSYAFSSGTSMASPAVTGSIALMYERYRQTHGGADPNAALMKALVCNTADDFGNAGPDYISGFGMLNTRRAIEALDSNRYFSNTVANGENKLHTIAVPPNTVRLKIMLYWKDTAAAANAAIALVNDLNLTVTDPSAVLHRPLILNPSPQGVNAVAVEGIDNLNNIEQVVLESPAAGSYSLRVNGSVVPFGPQDYIISYEIVKPSITLEYPWGGETLVPGETENIRWNAYGNEANNFTIEYSENNGANWTIINNNVPAGSKSYTWIVPSTATGTALLKVSRNGTALTGQSNINFTILPVAVIGSLNNACDGAIMVNWARIPGATSYDVLQLAGDSMKVIANTTDTSYLVKGLDKNIKIWVGILGKIGTVPGRRSLARDIIPIGGECTLASFNNDISVDSILEPNTARQGFANELNATRPIKIRIKNFGAVPVSGPFTVSFRYFNSTITETINTTIAAKGSYTYTFTGSYPIPAAGFRYDFTAWATLPADPNHLNDTSYKTVKYINNDPIITLPLMEGFESLTDTLFTTNEMGIGDNRYLDFSSVTPRGRARSFVNSDFAYSGTKALTLDQFPYSTSLSANSFTLNYNLNNFSARQTRFDFFYRNHGQDNAPGNKVWMRGSENDVWVEAYDLFANQANTGEWKRGVININAVLDNALPSQNITHTFQIRIGQEGYTSANLAHALTDLDDGYTFDNLELSEAFNDVAIIKVISPDKADCGLSASNPISIRVKNYENTTLVNIPVSYQVNSEPVVTEVISSISAGQTLDYVFSQRADLSAYIYDTIKVWVNHPTDTYKANDSILNHVVHNTPVINSYPYLQNFETNDGFFYSGGDNNSWAWGVPAKAAINKAASGTRAWVTNLTENYNHIEKSYLYSPCFNIQALVNPVLSFSHILITEFNYDYSWVEYSTDGTVWNKLGNTSGGTNWYDNISLNNWDRSNAKWHVASIELPLSLTNIRFRFVMSSDEGVAEEGIGIDDIHVFDKASIYNGSPVTGITQTVNGNNWFHFSVGSNRVVSLNPNGANLGATTIQVHPYTGPVRNSANQHYANRSVVIQPANPSPVNVGIRFYFTHTEAQNLVNATGCSSCLKPSDPYELGVTKYNGNDSEENGTLDDDITGFLQFISPANTAIIPYDNGYYAEFSVNNFSEFWLSAALLTPEATGVCPGDTILFTAGNGSAFQWQENSGTGFTNIVDGGIYSGVNTNQLKLINPPGGFSGYRYRSIVNGSIGIEKTIRFTNVWNGSANTNWFTPANWSCARVPDQYTDVIIPGGVTNFPVITANASVKSISINPGSPVTVSAGVKLDIYGK